MKSSVFFCENCGQPVPIAAKNCPHCGSRFTAVQCPQCSFVGDAELFASGCPQCGFRADSPGGEGSREPAKGQATAAGEEAAAPLRRYRKPAKQLPGWVYTVASLLLLIVVIGLVIIILRLH